MPFASKRGEVRHSEPAAPSPSVHLSECFLPSPSFDAKAKDKPTEAMYGAKLRHSRCEIRSQFLIELPSGFVAGGDDMCFHCCFIPDRGDRLSIFQAPRPRRRA